MEKCVVFIPSLRTGTRLKDSDDEARLREMLARSSSAYASLINRSTGMST